MPSLPPIHAVRRHLALLGLSVGLTQVPALGLLLLGARPSPAGWGAYLLASVGAAGGFCAVALAWWTRVQRIAALVRGYVEHGHLPNPGATDARNSHESVEASLASLDRLVRGLESDAARDPLTAIANRRACAARLEADLARSQRGHAPFSIVLFDLDDLKVINDGHGHSAGDAALCHLARLLEEALREEDWAGRWGGDEFLLGLWGADRAAAVATGERILSRLAAEPIPAVAGGLTLGSSAGVAQAETTDDTDRLFARADEALLWAKREGRGRVGVG